MRIELCGLPGSGKTWLVRGLGARLADSRSVPAPARGDAAAREAGRKRLLYKCLEAVRFASEHPLRVLRLLCIVRGGRSLTHPGVPSKVVNLLTELFRADRRDRDRLDIVDQGVVQAIWSLEMLSERSVADGLLRHTVSWLPERIFLVCADESQLKRQLQGRTDGRSRFDRLDGAALDAAIVKGRERLETILELWQQLVPDAQIAVLQNDGDALDALARALASIPARPRS